MQISLIDCFVFKENGLWNHVIKKINIRNYTIEYDIVKGFENKEDAVKSYEEADNDYQDTLKKIKEITDMRFTFMEYLDHWYRNYFADYSNSSNQGKYYWAIYKIIYPRVRRDVLIGNLSDTFVNDILDSCKDYSNSAGEIVSKVLRVILKEALRDGLIKENVISGMKMLYGKKKTIVLYNKEQMKTFLQAAKSYHSCYLEILLALFCGLRTGEILALRYTDFNSKNRTVTISQQYTRDYKYDKKESGEKDVKIISSERSFKPPKTLNSYRCLTVPQAIFDELKIRKKENLKLLQERQYKNFTKYICLGVKEGIKSDHTLNAGLSAITKSCGLPHITMHTLRHMCATILIERNVPLETISKILGHKNERTTFEIYCGVMDADEQIKETVSNTMNPALAVKAISVQGGM